VSSKYALTVAAVARTQTRDAAGALVKVGF
jgi:hypothetical protein